MTAGEAIKKMRCRIDTATSIAGKGVNGKAYEDMEIAIQALEEVQRYRAIGSVEECREAMERRRAKKPDKKPDEYTDLIQHYSCPVCGRYFGQAGAHNAILFDTPKYCTCGQAIDWLE